MTFSGTEPIRVILLIKSPDKNQRQTFPHDELKMTVQKFRNFFCRCTKIGDNRLTRYVKHSLVKFGQKIKFSKLEAFLKSKRKYFNCFSLIKPLHFKLLKILLLVSVSLRIKYLLSLIFLHTSVSLNCFSASIA